MSSSKPSLIVSAHAPVAPADGSDVVGNDGVTVVGEVITSSVREGKVDVVVSISDPGLKRRVRDGNLTRFSMGARVPTRLHSHIVASSESEMLTMECGLRIDLDDKVQLIPQLDFFEREQGTRASCPVCRKVWGA